METDAGETKAGSTQSGVHFNAIGQIAITVDDLAKSKDFYQNVLGMKFLFDAGNMAFFQCGDIRFMIGSSEQAVQRGGTILISRSQTFAGRMGCWRNTVWSSSRHRTWWQRCPTTICGWPFLRTRTETFWE